MRKPARDGDLEERVRRVLALWAQMTPERRSHTWQRMTPQQRRIFRMCAAEYGAEPPN